MTTIDYTQLDPGIRCVVRLLHRWGYETSDSGDGRTKQASGLYDERDLIAVPHVVITGKLPWSMLEGTTMNTDAARFLMWELNQAGIPVACQGEPGASIQYDYCPASDSATIMLMDLSDDDLPERLRAELEAEIASMGRKLSLSEAFQQLAEVCGDAWDGVDAAAYVDELRGKGDRRPDFGVEGWERVEDEDAKPRRRIFAYATKWEAVYLWEGDCGCVRSALVFDRAASDGGAWLINSEPSIHRCFSELRRMMNGRPRVVEFVDKAESAWAKTCEEASDE